MPSNNYFIGHLYLMRQLQAEAIAENLNYDSKNTPINKTGNNEILNLPNFLYIYTNCHELFANASKIGHLATLCNVQWQC